MARYGSGSVSDDDALRLRGILEAEPRAFNPMEPRDPHGRWTLGALGSKLAKLLGKHDPVLTSAGMPSGTSTKSVRFSNPAGKAGLFRILPERLRGKNGDGHIRNPDGSRGPWGHYGASGVMFRSVGRDGTTRYLMVQRGPAISRTGRWQFPGGASDQHENPFQGAARETVEELGLHPADLMAARAHGFHKVTIPGGWSYTSIAATVPRPLSTAGLRDPKLRAETMDARWFTAGEIRQLDSAGQLIDELSNGQLERNVLSLFPPS